MAAAIGLARQGMLQRAARIITTPQTQQPPVKGWNTRDPFTQMDELDAIQLDNWYPDYGGCVTRPGSQIFADCGVGPHQVNTLMVWGAGSNSALVAASNGHLFNVSGGTGSAPVNIGGTYTRDWWGWTNFNSRLVLCNGVDGVFTWTGPGSTITAGAFTIDSASGFGPSYINAMLGVFPVHNRLFFWTGRDTGFWYGPLNGIAGTVSYFPFDMITPRGGAVISINVLTYTDPGIGINTFTTFFLSSGTMLSYQGSDPTNPSNWNLVGYYPIAAPVGPATYPNRTVFNYGGDCYVSTSSDHVKLTQLLQALQSGTMPPRSKASGAQIAAVALAASQPGWQAIYWPYRRRLYFNIPIPDGSIQQHVYNPQLDAWSRNLDLQAYCWAVWNERMFFGSDQGKVIEHGAPEEVDTDQAASGTVSPISAAAVQSWNAFGTPLDKRVAMVRAILKSRAGASANVTLGFDYKNPSVNVPINVQGVTTVWGSPWGSPWSSVEDSTTEWEVADGVGSVISIGIAMQSYDQAIWTRTDFRLEPGNTL